MSYYTCPNCGSNRIFFDYEDGARKCLDCGYVLSESEVDQGPEWYRGPEKHKGRVRAEPSFTLGGTITMPMPYKLGELNQVKRFLRLIKTHKAVSRDSLADVRREVSRIIYSLNLPHSIIEEVVKKYEEARRRRITKGRSVRSVVAACILAVCKNRGIVRCNIKSLAMVSGVTEQEVKRCYSVLLKRGVFRARKVPSPVNFVPMLVDKLKLSPKVLKVACNICNEVKNTKRFQSKAPQGIAAAVVYLAAILCGERRRQEDVARAAEIAVPTLRKNLKKIMCELEITVTI